MRHIIFLMILTAAFVSGRSRAEHVDWSSASKINYLEDADKRAILLDAVAKSDFPFGFRLGHLLKTGGILAFRDYLLFLGSHAPTVRKKWTELPLSLGKQNSLLNEQLAEPNLGRILPIGVLRKKGIIKDSEEYSYLEIAKMVEKSITDWKVNEGFNIGDFDGEAGGADPYFFLREESKTESGKQ